MRMQVAITKPGKTANVRLKNTVLCEEPLKVFEQEDEMILIEL